MRTEVAHKIPFHDVDSLKIVWHGHYYKYFEMARTALYQACNLDVDQLIQSGFILPVIDSQCRYIQPLTYNQSVIITADFKTWNYYIEIEYRIICSDTDTLMAKGSTKQACCTLDNSIIFPLPEELESRICNA